MGVLNSKFELPRALLLLLGSALLLGHMRHPHWYLSTPTHHSTSIIDPKVCREYFNFEN